MQMLDEQTGLVPMTSKSKLTPRGKELFTNLTSYGFKAGLVLRAIEICGEQEFECQNWCANHVNDDTAKAPEVHLKSDLETDVMVDAFRNLVVEKPIKPMDGSDEILDVNQDHPLFSDLMRFGYKRQECIEAIRVCGYDENATLDYLQSPDKAEQERSR